MFNIKLVLHHSILYISMTSSSTIPTFMLEHLEYLRNLHLEGPRLGNIYLEDTALHSYLENHPISKNKPFQKEL